jgi:nicotinamidase-related amidase
VNPVLIVVDVQHGFLRPASQHVVPVIAGLVRQWQAAGRDVVFTRYYNLPDSQFERLIGWTEMRAGDPAVEIVPELRDLAGRAIVIDKHTYSSLTPEVRRYADRQGWTDFYIAGIATESCVLKTAVDVFEAGFTPWLIEDASASHAGPDVHDAGLLVARRFIGAGQIITAAQAAEQVAARAAS